MSFEQKWPLRRDKMITAWLLSVAGMVFLMVLLGGLTRLTHSGLSMVEWKPLTGWLPPMNEADWQVLFDLYRQSPEFMKVNAEMDLLGFEGIFWLEFIHRVWGRLIGLVFFLPFVAFIWKGWVDRPLGLRLAALFVLGGLQGAMGWFMVMSGLVDNPDVSQYRLTAHFGLALLIIAGLIWTALGVLYPEPYDSFHQDHGRLGRAAHWLFGLVALTAVSGGFVAGLDAGLYYNTFPLMDGGFVPQDFFELSPWWINMFEHVPTVQFDHRLLAELTFFAVLLFWLMARKAHLAPRTRRAVWAMAVMVVLQASLGIATLLLYVPVALASAHQMGAVVLFSLATWVAFEFRSKRLS